MVREGNERATSTHPTQAEAAQEGREIACRHETEFFLHAQDGRIREHNSHGEAKASEKGGKVTEGAQDLVRQIQEQTVKSAQHFYGESLGRLKGQLQSDRAQLESLIQQVPQEEVRAQIQEMVDSYTAIEESLDQVAQDLGVEDVVNQAVQQAQKAIGQTTQQGQEAQEEPPSRRRRPQGRRSTKSARRRRSSLARARRDRTPRKPPSRRPGSWAWTSPRWKARAPKVVSPLRTW